MNSYLYGLAHGMLNLEYKLLLGLQRLPLIGSDAAGSFWMLVTALGNPAWAFGVFYPIISGWSRECCLLFLTTAAFSDFMNGVLKWLLFGPRPYWLVPHNQSSLVEQFEVTCETGPGNPSGHVMVTAAIWFQSLRYLSRTSFGSPTVVRVLWGLWLCFLFLIAVSRLSIAAHFPHQVFFGFFAGVLIGHAVDRHRSKLLVGCGGRNYFQLAIILILMGVLIQLVLRGWLGLDPDWSIHLARKHCANADWIHVSTTPLVALSRDIGALLGLGTLWIWNQPLVEYYFSNRPSGKISNSKPTVSEYGFWFYCIRILKGLINLSVAQLYLLGLVSNPFDEGSMLYYSFVVLYYAGLVQIVKVSGQMFEWCVPQVLSTKVNKW